MHFITSVFYIMLFIIDVGSSQLGITASRCGARSGRFNRFYDGVTPLSV